MGGAEGARYQEKFNGWNPIAVEFSFDRSKRSAALALEANAHRFNLPFFVFSYGSAPLCGSLPCSIADKLLPQSGKKPKRTEADGIWPLISLSPVPCCFFLCCLNTSHHYRCWNAARPNIVMHLLLTDRSAALRGRSLWCYFSGSFFQTFK